MEFKMWPSWTWRHCFIIYIWTEEIHVTFIALRIKDFEVFLIFPTLLYIYLRLDSVILKDIFICSIANLSRLSISFLSGNRLSLLPSVVVDLEKPIHLAQPYQLNTSVSKYFGEFCLNVTAFLQTSGFQNKSLKLSVISFYCCLGHSY